MLTASGRRPPGGLFIVKSVKRAWKSSTCNAPDREKSVKMRRSRSKGRHCGRGRAGRMGASRIIGRASGLNTELTEFKHTESSEEEWMQFRRRIMSANTSEFRKRGKCLFISF